MSKLVTWALVAGLALVCGNAAVAQTGGGHGKSGGTSKPAKPTPPKKEDPPKQTAAAEKPSVPFFGNTTCPVDSKLADKEKFVDVEGQRVYVCSDTCKDAVTKDGKAMLAKAYPSTTPVVGKGCPMCTKPIASGQAKDVVFEGRRVQVCSDACITTFKANPWLVLVQVNWPDAKDAKNTTDPFDGKPVDPAILAVYKRHILHFSSQKSLAALEKDPDAALAKLKIASTP